MESPGRTDARARHQRHYAELVRLGFALTGDWGLAEELAQEAFVRTWHRWNGIRRPEAAPAAATRTRPITSSGGVGLTRNPAPAWGKLGILLAWGAIGAVVAVWRFRWTPRSG